MTCVIIIMSDRWRVQPKLCSASADDTPLGKVRPCDIHKLANSFKFRKAPVLDGIPNKSLRYLTRKPLLHLTHLFNHCLLLFHFPKPWKEAKVIMLPKPGKYPKFPQNLYSISLLSGKLFEKVLKVVQKHVKERGLLNASQFGFHAYHSMPLQCMRLMDHVT
jgi:hypothetical protein